MALSERKQQIIETIIVLIGEKYSGNFSQEIGKRINMAPSNVAKFIKEMEKVGILSRVFPYEVNFVNYHKELLTGGSRLEELKKLKEKGLTYEEIGEVFGISRQRVKQILDK